MREGNRIFISSCHACGLLLCDDGWWEFQASRGSLENDIVFDRTQLAVLGKRR